MPTKTQEPPSVWHKSRGAEATCRVRAKAKGSLTLVPGSLHLLLGSSLKALLLPIWGSLPENSNPVLSLGFSCPALHLPCLDQDAQVPVPHTSLPAPLHTRHRESQESGCPDRGSDRVVMSRWKQQQPRGLERGERVVPGILASSHFSPSGPRDLTSVLGILPAQYPAAGPQGDAPWVKADGQG